MQVMARLRDHTGPLNLLCIKTIDGAIAEIAFPAGAEVLHSSRMRPAFTQTDMRSATPLALSTLARHDNEQAVPRVRLSLIELHGQLLLVSSKTVPTIDVTDWCWHS